jgi:phospholipid/cholesterol/gamma-HCH transport system substrate-binding protein
MDAFEDRPTRTSIAVGLLALATLGALAWAIAFFLAKERPLAATYAIEVRFADVGGLRPGAPVTLAGLAIGRVDGLAIDSSGPETRWRAALSLRDEPWIRREITPRTSFALVAESVFGNKYVNASFGEGAAPLADGAVVDGAVGAAIDARAFEKLSSALENLSGAAAELRSLLATPTSSALAGGATATAQPNVREAIANLDATLRNTTDASGALKDALSPENQAKTRQTFDDISKSAANLAVVTERMKTGMESWNDTMEKMRFWRGWFGGGDKKDDKKKDAER